MCKSSRFNYDEDIWAFKMDARVDTINELLPMKDHKFDIDYAYGGARLVSKKIDTGAKADLSRRYYYDDGNEPDYDDMCEMLDTIIAVLKAKRDNEQGKNEW